MSRVKKLSMLMGKKPEGEYPMLRNGSLTATHLVEAVSDTRSGNTGDNMKRMLVETTGPVKMEIVEGKTAPNGNIYVRGEFGRCDVPTLNGRIYPKKLMAREISRLQEAIKSRAISMCGTCDHPADGKTSIERISHIITDLRMDDDGVVYGEAEILRKTPAGQTLMGLIESNIKVPVSSRGYGSTAPSRGKMEGEEVQEDFVLKVYDFVSDPAVTTAVPEVFSEDVDDPSLADMFIERFPEIARELSGKALNEDAGSDGKDISAIKEELSESFERKLKDAIVGLRDEVSLSLREEYESDPEIGGAKGVLAMIADMVHAYRQDVSEDAELDADKARELEISNLKSERDSLKEDVLYAQQALYLEKKIAGHKMAESIRTLIGGRLFESNDKLDEALNTILGDIPEGGYVSEEVANLREENASLKGEITLLESKVEDLKDKVGRAIKLGERVENQRIDSINKANEKIDGLEAKLEETINELSESKSRIEELNSLVEEKEEAVKLAEYKLEKVASVTNGRKLSESLRGAKDISDVDVKVKNRELVEFSDPMLRNMQASLKTPGKLSRNNVIIEDFEQEGSFPIMEDELGIDMGYMARLAGIPTHQQES